MMLFLIFAITLLGIAIFHKHNLRIGLLGVTVITTYKVIMTGFKGEFGVTPLAQHLGHESIMLVNVCLLIIGFEIVAQYFKASRLPNILPAYLAGNWWGSFQLLLVIFVGSAFLDNIAAALIGGTVARVVYREKVSVGFIAAITACANAGGAGSVIGDTTTTMAWISGVSVGEILPAFAGSIVMFVFVAFFAARQQQIHQPIMKDPEDDGVKIETKCLMIVLLVLGFAAIVNTVVNSHFKEIADSFPWIGTSVAVGLGIASGLKTAWKPDWIGVRHAIGSAVFLGCLIISASMMPIEELPKPTLVLTFILGPISAFFDNIPLTKLALDQSGYVWSFLVYAVGCGGSMNWFGSSAGVTLTGDFPEARSLWQWWKQGWFVAPGYAIGYLAMIIFVKW